MARKGLNHRKDRRSLRYQHKREDLTDPDLPLTEKLSPVTYRRRRPKGEL